jgi:hypothetical protein
MSAKSRFSRRGVTTVFLTRKTGVTPFSPAVCKKLPPFPAIAGYDNDCRVAEIFRDFTN